jgi:hypothetical protein
MIKSKYQKDVKGLAWILCGHPRQTGPFSQQRNGFSVTMQHIVDINPN